MKKCLRNAKGLIVLEDDQGRSVNFSDSDEFLRYLGTPFPIDGIKTVNYEPARGMHLEFDGQNTFKKPVPDSTYEQFIAEIPTLVERKANHLYGLSGEALVLKERELAEKQIRETHDFQSKAPVTVSVSEGTFTFNGGESSAAAINGAVELAIALGETEVGIWDVDNIIHLLSFESAKTVAAHIGYAYRESSYKKQRDLVAMANGTYTGS